MEHSLSNLLTHEEMTHSYHDNFPDTYLALDVNPDHSSNDDSISATQPPPPDILSLVIPTTPSPLQKCARPTSPNSPTRMAAMPITVQNEYPSKTQDVVRPDLGDTRQFDLFQNTQVTVDCIKKNRDPRNFLDINWSAGSGCCDQDAYALKSNHTGLLKEEGQKMTDDDKQITMLLGEPKDVASFKGVRKNPGTELASLTEK